MDNLVRLTPMELQNIDKVNQKNLKAVKSGHSIIFRVVGNHILIGESMLQRELFKRLELNPTTLFNGDIVVLRSKIPGDPGELLIYGNWWNDQQENFVRNALRAITKKKMTFLVIDRSEAEKQLYLQEMQAREKEFEAQANKNREREAYYKAQADQYQADQIAKMQAKIKQELQAALFWTDPNIGEKQNIVFLADWWRTRADVILQYYKGREGSINPDELNRVLKVLMDVKQGLAAALQEVDRARQPMGNGNINLSNLAQSLYDAQVLANKYLQTISPHITEADNLLGPAVSLVGTVYSILERLRKSVGGGIPAQQFFSTNP